MRNVTKALSVVQKILDLLKSFHQTVEGDALVALERDTKYIEECISFLESGQKDQIEEVWRGAQNITKFLGGDYLSNPAEEERLHQLMDEFFRELLDAVVESRRA